MEWCESMMAGDMAGGMAAGMWIGMLLWGLLVVALIALAVAGTVRLVRGASAGQSNSTLREPDLRYARGEIERDDYLQRRADLGHEA